MHQGILPLLLMMHRMDPNCLVRPKCQHLELSAVFAPKASKFDKERNLVKTLQCNQ